jgi:TP901 family phage tail tape measure protein
MAGDLQGITIEFGANTVEFDRSLRNINNALRTLGSFTKSLNSDMKFDGSSADKLRQKIDSLKQSISLSEEAIGEYKRQIEELGEGEVGSQKWMNLQRNIIVTEGKIKGFQRGISASEKEMLDLKYAGSSTVEKISNGLGNLGKKMKATFDVNSFKTAFQANISADMVKNLSTSLQNLGKQAMAAAGDYEQSMNLVAQATGAPDKELKSLSTLAKKMGADTVFSAKESADAMLELAKSGMTPAQISGGALQSTLALAASSGMDLATSASITANTMNTFGLSVKDTAKAVDALAGGANASTADVSDLSQALSQVGPGATNAGMSLNETVAALAAFADNGIKGSDAGTSLKTMLQRLVPQTDKAKKAMKEYGLSFVDSKGNFNSMKTVADKLQKKLGGLSEAERARALNTIFGSDATRAATVLMKEGSSGINKYIKATKTQGSAADMANARMKGWKGTVEQLNGSFETLAIEVGEKLAPFLTKIANKIQELTEWFRTLSPTIQGVVIGIAAIGAALGPVLVGISLIIPALGGIASIGSMVIGTFTQMALSSAVAGGGISGLSAAFGTLSIAMGPIGWTMVAIAAIGSLATLAIKSNAAAENQRKHTEYVRSGTQAIDAHTRAQQNLSLALTAADESVDKRIRAEANEVLSHNRLIAAKKAVKDAEAEYGKKSKEAKAARAELTLADQEAQMASLATKDAIKEESASLQNMKSDLWQTLKAEKERAINSNTAVVAARARVDALEAEKNKLIGVRGAENKLKETSTALTKAKQYESNTTKHATESWKQANGIYKTAPDLLKNIKNKMIASIKADDEMSKSGKKAALKYIKSMDDQQLEIIATSLDLGKSAAESMQKGMDGPLKPGKIKTDELNKSAEKAGTAAGSKMHSAIQRALNRNYSIGGHVTGGYRQDSGGSGFSPNLIQVPQGAFAAAGAGNIFNGGINLTIQNNGPALRPSTIQEAARSIVDEIDHQLGRRI